MIKMRRMTTISDRLSIAMQHAGFRTQTALGVAAGLPPATVNRLLKRVGKQGPETATVKRLAEACGVRSEWLMDGSGPMHPLATLLASTQPLAKYKEPERYPMYSLEGLAKSAREPIGYAFNTLVLGPTGFAIDIDEDNLGSIGNDPNLLKMATLTVFAKQEQQVEPGRILVVLRRDSPVALIRRLTVLEGVEFWESLNPMYPLRFKQREKDDRIIGVVQKMELVMSYAK